MRLYHNPMSSNARRTLMTAIHLELPVELAEVDLMNMDDRRRLAELNPNVKVPVLADGTFLLWESCAIMQYLAGKAPGQTVYPEAPQARADIDRAIALAPRIEALLTQGKESPGNAAASFDTLAAILATEDEEESGDADPV